MTDQDPTTTWHDDMIARVAELEAEAETLREAFYLKVDLIVAKNARIEALEAERDEMAAALDSEHASVGHNIWRFWSDKAREIAERNKALGAERDRYREAFDSVLIGGNHLVVWLGPDHPPVGTPHETVLNRYGASVTYDVWCCWNAIMQAREALGETEK